MLHGKLETRVVHRTHTPCGTSTGYSAATIDVASLPMSIEQVLSRILCSCMALAYGHIRGVGVTARVLFLMGLEATKRWSQCYE